MLRESDNKTTQIYLPFNFTDNLQKEIDFKREACFLTLSAYLNLDILYFLANKV